MCLIYLIVPAIRLDPFVGGNRLFVSRYIYIYSCEPTTLSIHQSVLSFGLCISVCLIIHPIILSTYYLPIYLSILLPLRPSIYLSNSFHLIESSLKNGVFPLEC